MPATTAASRSGIRRVKVGATGHRYLIDDKKAIGVTTALGLAVAKPGLMYWAAKCTAEEAVEIIHGKAANEWTRDADLITHLARAAERRRNAAAVRGTKIHHHAEALVKGDPVDVEPELAPYVENCARFFDDWKIQPLLKEKTVGSYRWGYCGTFDLIASLPDGRRVLFDYKTGKSIYPEVQLQLAAYRHADAYVASAGVEVPMHEVGITEAKIVHLRADGYDVIALGSGPGEFKTFLHALQVARAVQNWTDWTPVTEQAPK